MVFFFRLLSFLHLFADCCHSLLLVKAEPYLAEMHWTSISLYTSGKKENQCEAQSLSADARDDYL